MRPLVTRAEPVVYEFHDQAGGTIELLGSEDSTLEADARRVAGMRLVLVGDDPSRADVLAGELRRVNVEVVVVDVRGNGLDRARELDPDVVLIDEEAVRGDGFELVRRVREDARLRWASLLVVATDELWPKARSAPLLPKLIARLGPLSLPSRTLRERMAAGEAFDTRLETLGPVRILRAAAATPGTWRIGVHGRRAIPRRSTSRTGSSRARGASRARRAGASRADGARRAARARERARAHRAGRAARRGERDGAD